MKLKPLYFSIFNMEVKMWSLDVAIKLCNVKFSHLMQHLLLDKVVPLSKCIVWVWERQLEII